MNIKTIAMYLPQFHRIPENDAWWGTGFTEWIAVKRATCLIENQQQPKKPLNDNYYNLLDKEIMEWQAELAEKYSVYGFCFYHYWFENGKKLLEKPAENLLKWKDINIHFCFSWANEPWARTWSKLATKNVWADEYETTDNKHESNGVLVAQKYGGEREWREHYEYLKEFFLDERYICIENKPVFIIYKPDQIPCMNEMLEHWNVWSRIDGFDGIYTIATNTLDDNKHFEAQLFQEPLRTMGKEWYDQPKRYVKNGVTVYDYDDTWKKIIMRKNTGNMKTYCGGFVNYDDTPRRGKNGKFFDGVSVQKFQEYFLQLVKKNLQLGNEFLFLNAWNEWGEGMYLEPDETNKYDYLEAIRKVVNTKIEISIDEQKKENFDKRIEEYENKMQLIDARYRKFKDYFDILNSWMNQKEEGKSLSKYFEKNEFYHVAIYGMGILGKHLLTDLEGSSIIVEYGIDRLSGKVVSNIPMRNQNEDYDGIDVIIVTATFDFNSIYEKLRERCTCPIVSLKQVVEEA